MDFSWTQAQEELYQKMRDLTRDALWNTDREVNAYWTRAEWQTCGALGLLGLCVPGKYGGGDHSATMTARLIEAFGYGCEDMGLVFSASAHLLSCAMPLVEYGEEALKKKYLPGLSSGELVGANAITEQEAGSDVFALKTRAVRQDDSYILSGLKSYVSNGPVADLFVVYAVTNPVHGYMGVTGFVVEKGTPGLVVGEPFHKIGLTSTPACQVRFEECRVPIANRIGREGQGAQVFKRSMQWERSCLFALYLGQMERELERTLAYARERHQFGKSIGKHQAVAHRLADMKLRLEAARLLLYRACWLLDQGQDSTLAISLAKLAVSEAAIQGGLDAIHIHGSVGVGYEYGIERMLRDAIPSAIFSGTSEMQRNIIANELGL